MGVAALLFIGLLQVGSIKECWVTIPWLDPSERVSWQTHVTLIKQFWKKEIYSKVHLLALITFLMKFANAIYYNLSDYYDMGLSWWLSGRESACQYWRHRFDPWVGKIPWRRKWQPTPVFLPGKSHRQRRLAGYSPWCHKESNTT